MINVHMTPFFLFQLQIKLKMLLLLGIFGFISSKRPAKKIKSFICMNEKQTYP